MYCCCWFVCLLFSPSCCLFCLNVVISVCFDCKCKSFKRLSENRKATKQHINTTETLREKHIKQNINTGYPAHEPPRINITYLFAEVRGLDILYFYCVVVFSKLFCLIYVYVLCVRLVFVSCCIYNRQKKTYKT